MKKRIQSLNEYWSEISNQPQERKIQNDLVHFILSLNSQIKLLHWQVDDKNIHEDLDDVYNDFQEEMDELIEMVQAEYGIGCLENCLEVVNIEKIECFTEWSNIVITKLEDFKAYFCNEAIQNEITDIIEIFTKLKYKLTLK